MDGGTRIEPSAIGGGLEGADKLAREMALWMPSRQSPDRIINGVKETADARSRDSVRNNGYVAGVANIHKNEIIGAQYRLNAQPNWRFLSVLNKGFNEDWADEFQQVVEARFNLLADSAHCWLDAERTIGYRHPAARRADGPARQGASLLHPQQRLPLHDLSR
jgi:capsid protein